MTESNILTNELYLVGEITKAPIINHQLHDLKFYSLSIATTRHSGTQDIIEIIVPEKSLIESKLGDLIEIKGELRTHDYEKDNKKSFSVFGYAQTMRKLEKDEFDSIENKNVIKLIGTICKSPNFRTINERRNITDLLIAVNRQFKKSDYIPCIAWGSMAIVTKDYNIGDKVVLEGRLQSRIKTNKTFYDLSIKTIKNEKEV